MINFGVDIFLILQLRLLFFFPVFSSPGDTLSSSYVTS